MALPPLGKVVAADASALLRKIRSRGFPRDPLSWKNG
jgi:hypothetical protein